ncbi:hypothetical protein Tco_0363849 [Tanacetum coccineum]
MDNEKAKETKVTKDKVQPESSQSTANVQPRVDHGKGKDKLKDNEKGINEKEKDDEVRESVFEEILIDKEEFFLPNVTPPKFRTTQRNGNNGVLLHSPNAQVTENDLKRDVL